MGLVSLVTVMAAPSAAGAQPPEPSTFGPSFFISMIIIIAAIYLLFVRDGRSEVSPRDRYREALEAIRKDPAEPRVRQRALDLGREFFRRNNGGKEVTLLQETQIMNEIGLAASGCRVSKDGSLRVTVTNAPSLSGGRLADEIKKLGELFTAGYLTAEEFERGKATLLGAPEDKAIAAVELLEHLSNLKAQGVLSDSEFNMKKWDILSERLLPGGRRVGPLPQRGEG